MNGFDCCVALVMTKWILDNVDMKTLKPKNLMNFLPPFSGHSLPSPHTQSRLVTHQYIISFEPPLEPSVMTHIVVTATFLICSFNL